ncbi:MAG: hypothetical protein FIB07_13495 [Candidatus Methanoperedens sp.]|nr:hypothetical protein [Candidatus Methanoperedens sp.]
MSHLKEQILLSSAEIMKMVLLFSSLLLGMKYMLLYDRCNNAWKMLPKLQCEPEISTNLVTAGIIFFVYFWCLLYVFGHEKKEPKKLDDDFVPYPIKVESEKRM